MRFIEVEAPQRSAAWFEARLGLLTGSRAEDMLATILKGEAAKRRDYRTQIVLERLTGLPQEDRYQSPDMLRGIAQEREAVAAYEALSGHLVRPSGFLRSLDLLAGCSLDGHVGAFEGVVEVKCPRSANHLEALRLKRVHGDGPAAVPPQHIGQLLHALWITGAAWADFVSFDNRFPAGGQIVCSRLQRDQRAIDGYALKACAFLAEVAAEVEAVRILIAEAA